MSEKVSIARDMDKELKCNKTFRHQRGVKSGLFLGLITHDTKIQLVVASSLALLISREHNDRLAMCLFIVMGSGIAL